MCNRFEQTNRRWSNAECLTAGVTVLILKNENTERPWNYTPKLNKIRQKNIGDKNLIPKERKWWCRR